MDQPWGYFEDNIFIHERSTTKKGANRRFK
jgi:hypothetical protein